LLSSASAAPAGGFPTANQDGDYRGQAAAWMLWQVTDADPDGLNCRASEPFESGEWLEVAYSDKLDNWIGRLPVVAYFRLATVLFVNSVPSGLALWYDDADKPWLRVRLSTDGDRMCFVRANNRYIKPVRSSLDRTYILHAGVFGAQR